jgi:hypothetical protein
LYPQHSIFFVIYEWVHKVRALHHSGQEMNARDKHSRLLGPFKRNKENKVV